MTGVTVPCLAPRDPYVVAARHENRSLYSGSDSQENAADLAELKGCCMLTGPRKVCAVGPWYPRVFNWSQSNFLYLFHQTSSDSGWHQSFLSSTLYRPLTTFHFLREFGASRCLVYWHVHSASRRKPRKGEKRQKALWMTKTKQKKAKSQRRLIHGWDMNPMHRSAHIYKYEFKFVKKGIRHHKTSWYIARCC